MEPVDRMLAQQDRDDEALLRHALDKEREENETQGDARDAENTEEVW
jgi:hypothetical protein